MWGRSLLAATVLLCTVTCRPDWPDLDPPPCFTAPTANRPGSANSTTSDGAALLRCSAAGPTLGTRKVHCWESCGLVLYTVDKAGSTMLHDELVEVCGPASTCEGRTLTNRTFSDGRQAVAAVGVRDIVDRFISGYNHFADQRGLMGAYLSAAEMEAVDAAEKALPQQGCHRAKRSETCAPPQRAPLDARLARLRRMVAWVAAALLAEGGSVVAAATAAGVQRGVSVHYSPQSAYLRGPAGMLPVDVVFRVEAPAEMEAALRARSPALDRQWAAAGAAATRKWTGGGGQNSVRSYNHPWAVFRCEMDGALVAAIRAAYAMDAACFGALLGVGG